MDVQADDKSMNKCTGLTSRYGRYIYTKRPETTITPCPTSTANPRLLMPHQPAALQHQSRHERSREAIEEELER